MSCRCMGRRAAPDSLGPLVPVQGCVCGNVFTDDDRFCRKCGSARPEPRCACGTGTRGGLSCGQPRPGAPPPPSASGADAMLCTFSFAGAAASGSPSSSDGWVVANIGSVAGVPVSLRVTTSGSVSSHTINGDFAEITPGEDYVSSGITVTYTLVQADSLSTTVTPGAFPLSIYDLDNDESLRVVTSGYTASLSSDTKVVRSGDSFSGDGTDDGGPSSATSLTPAESSRSVTLTFTGTSTCQVVYKPQHKHSLFSFTMEASWVVVLRQRGQTTAGGSGYDPRVTIRPQDTGSEFPISLQHMGDTGAVFGTATVCSRPLPVRGRFDPGSQWGQGDNRGRLEVDIEWAAGVVTHMILMGVDAGCAHLVGAFRHVFEGTLGGAEMRRVESPLPAVAYDAGTGGAGLVYYQSMPAAAIDSDCDSPTSPLSMSCRSDCNRSTSSMSGSGNWGARRRPVVDHTVSIDKPLADAGLHDIGVVTEGTLCTGV
eukprot:gene33466-8182_t